MKILLDAPLNGLSLGNVSFNIIREFHKRNLDLRIFPTGEIDLKSYDISSDLKAYIENAINNRLDFLKPDIPVLRVWHLNGSEQRKNKDQYLLTFYECNDPTEVEMAFCKAQDRTIFTSNVAKDHFAERGADNVSYVPLGLDEDFFVTNKPYLKGVTHFGLMGKFENRKHTAKILKAWLKKYGNDNKYQLSCCITNPFFKPEQMQQVINQALEGRHYTNLNFLPHLTTNSEVNELLNAIDIDLTGLSGGEGWNLPAFNATCLGKWSVVLNETSHKDWATENNCILIESSGKMPAEDGVFFNKGATFNQGEFYTWTEDEAIAAMEMAANKVGEINTEGLKLGKSLTYKNTVDSLLKIIFNT